MIEKLIREHKILICVGSGGVGKTTVSASLGVLAAQLGLKVLVMTIDPSKRLKIALGIRDDNTDAVIVPGQNYKGKIWAVLLDAQKIFRDFILGASSTPDMAKRISNNRLYQQLSTTLSGSQEFTSLLQLTRIENAAEYDLVILDTPPAQHAIDFLEAPEKINSLFQEGVVRWFLGDEEEIGFVRRLISKGTKTVLAALEMVTGSRFMQELSDFFQSVRTVQGSINQKTQKVREILQSSKTGFVLVTGFDEAKLKEAESLKGYLDKQDYHLLATIMNRAFPQWPLDANVEDPNLKRVYDQWHHFHSPRQKTYNEFKAKWAKSLPVLTIPDLNKDLSGLESLEEMSNELIFASKRFDSLANDEHN